MLFHQSLELADELGVKPSVEVPLDPALEAGEPELLEARDLRLREPPVRELGERRPAPERKRFVEAQLVDETLEALQIELVRIDADDVPRCLGDEPVPPEHLAEL